MKVKNFVKYVARGFGISPSESRAGIVLFSSNASINVVTYSHRRLILGLQNTKLCYNCLVSVYVLISPRARLQEGKGKDYDGVLPECLRNEPKEIFFMSNARANLLLKRHYFLISFVVAVVAVFFLCFVGSVQPSIFPTTPNGPSKSNI